MATVDLPTVRLREHHSASDKVTIRRSTQSHCKQNTGRALASILENHVIIAIAALLPEYAVDHAARWLYAVVYLLAVLIISSRLRAFENLVHEASHHNLFERTHQHYSLQCLYSFPVFKDVASYRKEHIEHHRYLGDPEKDPDLHRMIGLGVTSMPSRPWRAFFATPLTGYLVYEWLCTTFVPFWAARTSRRAKLMYWIVVVSVCWTAGTLHYLMWYYVVPLLVVLPVTRFWAECSEHIGLDLRDSIGSSRTNNGVVHRWYLHPENDGYHTVHHINPRIPFHSLPLVHQQLLQENAAFRERAVISSGPWQTFGQMRTTETLFRTK